MTGEHDSAGGAVESPAPAEPHSPQTAERVFDGAELRRIIALSFSAGELSKFAERFKVFVGRTDPAQGARNLVRAMESRGELARLVAHLRQAKPLVEWPQGREPQPAASDHAEPQPATSDHAEPQPAASDDAEPAPAPLVDPYVEELAAEQAKAQNKLLVPLAAVFGAGLLLGAVGLWLVARDDAPAPDPGTQLETGSVAQLAADHLERSIGGVMKSCDSKPVDSVRDSLAAAFRRCAQPPIRPGVAPFVPPAPKSQPDPEPQPPAAPPRKAAPSRASACLKRCEGIHAMCQQSECGAEPRSSAKYANYQKCMSGCLTKFSRCRLSCR